MMTLLFPLFCPFSRVVYSSVCVVLPGFCEMCEGSYPPTRRGIRVSAAPLVLED